MAIPGIELIQPGETKAVSIDYSSNADRPGPTVNVTAGQWTLIDEADQANKTATNLSDGATAYVETNIVSGTLFGLTSGHNYKLTLITTFSDGQEIEDEILIKCRDL